MYHIASAVSDNTFYTMQEGWTRHAQYALQTNKLPAVFQFLPSLMESVLGLIRPSRRTIVVIDGESVSPQMQHRGHGYQRIVRIQSCAVYNYWPTDAQAWKFKQDSRIAQEMSLEHCQGASHSSCERRKALRRYSSRGVVASVIRGIGTSNVDGVLRLHKSFSKYSRDA